MLQQVARRIRQTRQSFDTLLSIKKTEQQPLAAVLKGVFAAVVQSVSCRAVSADGAAEGVDCGDNSSSNAVTEAEAFDTEAKKMAMQLAQAVRTCGLSLPTTVVSESIL